MATFSLRIQSITAIKRTYKAVLDTVSYFADNSEDLVDRVQSKALKDIINDKIFLLSLIMFDNLLSQMTFFSEYKTMMLIQRKPFVC